MNEDSWREKYDREAKERATRDRKTFEKYQAHRAKDLIEKKRGGAKYGGGEYTEWRYREAEKNTATEHMIKETVFCEYDNGEFYKRTSSTKRQKLLCVNGPLIGNRVIPEEVGGEYLQFNGAYHYARRSRTDPKIPTAVLVHKSAFEEKP